MAVADEKGAVIAAASVGLTTTTVAPKMDEQLTMEGEVAEEAEAGAEDREVDGAEVGAAPSRLPSE